MGGGGLGGGGGGNGGGDGGHGGKHGGAILPDTMRWIWRGHEK